MAFIYQTGGSGALATKCGMVTGLSLSKNNVGDSSRGNTTKDINMDAELELFAQRDLAFLQMRGGNSDNANHK